MDHKNFTDPTYLRSIYDGLSAGSINKDNATALPIGLVGVYEEALPPASNVNERKKFLEFFAVWAILKKEVSAAFVLPLLEGWTEQEVIDFIGRYSKWFNSPASGTYILYHERLRAFVQQKISHKQFIDCNDLLVKNAQAALIDKNGNEWERYALQYLSTHILISAIEIGDSSDLKALAYNTTHWNRQVEISKGFEWSKNMLNDMMLWASKYDDDEVIECALNKVDLYLLEQNDAPLIVYLVAQNDIETALNRIEAFGGNDTEGLQRKFILYMLCLMELTLLESKDKPFRKEAIEKLLKHLDDNMPVDHSVLNWDDFFPSYLMFKLACEWAELGLEYLRVYKRTDDWDSDWIQEKGPYTDQYFEILLNCAKGISDELGKNKALTAISLELAKQGRFEESLACALDISNEYSDKERALSAISLEFAKQGRFDEALEYARDIKNKVIKSIAASAISSELATQGRFDEAASAIQESIAYAKGASNLDAMGDALSAICGELAKQGLLEEAQACAKWIKGERGKSVAFKSISNELAKQGRIYESLKFAKDISNEWIMYDALTSISRELVKKGRVKESLECAQNITDEFEKNKAHSAIFLELAKQGGNEESLAFANNISNEWTDKYKTLSAISNEFSKQGLVEEAAVAMQASIQYAHGISDEREKSKAYSDICHNLSKQGRFDEAVLIMQKCLRYERGLRNEREKFGTLDVISLDLAKQGKVEDSIACAKEISLEFGKNNTLINISLEFAKQGKVEESIACAKKISIEFGKGSELSAISTELAKQGSIEGAHSAMQESINNAKDISDEYKKNNALINISLELAKQGKVEESVALAQDISNERSKSYALMKISLEFAKKGKVEEAQACAKGISAQREKNEALSGIPLELAKQGKVEEAILFAKGISDEKVKKEALCEITIEFAKQGRLEEAIACSQGISGERRESEALSAISNELAKQSRFDEAWAYVKGARDAWAKDEALGNISFGMAKQGRFVDALANAQRVSDEWAKNNAIGNISLELVKLGRLEESMQYARGIFDERDMNTALSKISKELAKQGYWTVAEEVGLEITQSSARFRCFEDLAKNAFNENGWHLALNLVPNFQNAEFKICYLKVIVELINASICNKNLILNSRKYLMNDPESLEKLLQQHALHELFFTDAKPEKTQRFNRTLNLQWAIDIKNSFSANGS